MKPPFLQFNLDESILDAYLASLIKKIDSQEKFILDLQNQMKDRPTRQEMKNQVDALAHQFQKLADDMNNRFDGIDDSIRQTLDNIRKDIEAKFNDKLKNFDLQLQKRLEGIEMRIPAEGFEVKDLVDRMRLIEDNVHEQTKKLHSTRDFVQTVASSIGLFNKTHAQLDNSLEQVLGTSVNSVTNNIQLLFDEVNRLKGGTSTSSQVINKIVSSDGSPTGNINGDISDIELYPSMIAHWKDPPELPPLSQFNNVNELVDYFYKLIPKLQAHLTAMHGKILENAAELAGKADKNIVEKMFEKFQQVMSEIANRVDELKEAVEETATREEINEMIEDLLASMNNEGNTAIGRVKCIACGRDINQVTGASGEEEIYKTLGAAPNSHPYQSSSRLIGVQYTTRDKFDSAIIESPRSIRPFRPASQMKTRVRQVPK